MHQIRPAALEDAGPWAQVVLDASPHLVLDERSEAHLMRHEPADAVRFVAVDDSSVVGVARCRTYGDEDDVSLMVMVLGTHRRRGIGRQLFDAVLTRAEASGKPRAAAIVEDDEGSRIASARWGFSTVRSLQKSMVDPRTAPAPGASPEGVTVVPIEVVGPERVWRAHQQVARDDPSGLTVPMPWEDWLSDWADPRARPDLGRAVLTDDGDLAAYSLIGTAGDRAWSDMTGTLPPYRGRGLAFLAKQHTLHAAAGAGITRAMTGNDGQNLPMLAVNDRLGYVVVARPAVAERALR